MPSCRLVQGRCLAEGFSAGGSAGVTGSRLPQRDVLPRERFFPAEIGILDTLF